MRKITKLVLTLAMLFGVVGGANSVFATKLYATYGTPAANGSFDSVTGVYSWTGSSNNLMDMFTFGSGELANYVSLHFSTSDYVTGPFRVCFMNGSTAVATIAFYSDGDKNLVFSERPETKDLDLSQITSIKFGGASGSGSITITKKPYIVKPMSLTWSDDGTAEIDITDLTASDGFSLNDQTGELTGTGSYGELSINFPAGGVDLTSLTGFSVTYTGDNLFNNFEIGDGTTNKGFWSSVTGRDDLNQYMTVENVGAPTAITYWKWFNNSTAGTMTISSIKLKAGVITASNPHETLLKSSMFIGGCENHIGEYVGQGTTIYGNGSVLAEQYVDLSAYDEMRIYGTPNKTIRLLFNWGSANQKEITGDGVKLNSEGYYSLDLSTVAPQQLNAFKFPWDGQSGSINKVILYKASVPVAYTYVISGSGSLSTSAIAALADATATSIDATGITAATSLPTANPNCLIVANDGMVTNTKNVIVSSTCANLELVDGKPFKAPSAFTATNAKFTKTVSDAQYATMVVPFNVVTLPTTPSTVTAYNLTAVAGEKITSSSTSTLTADKPVLINAAAGDYEFIASGVEIVATADGLVSNGLLKASYAGTTAAADANNYVLQKNGDDVNFYLVTTTAANVKPFRAYLDGSGAAPVLFLDLNNETTGIADVRGKKEEVRGDFFDLQGRKVTQPTKGLYIVNGKKVVLK